MGEKRIGVFFVETYTQHQRYALSIIIFLTVLATLHPHEAYAQEEDYLLLSWLNRDRSVRFYAGEEMRFKVASDPSFHRAVILRFEDDYVVFPDYRIDVDSITAIDVRKKPVSRFNVNSYANKLPIAGGAYFLVDYLRNDGVDRSTVIVSSALVGTGLLAGILKKKVFKPDSKRTLAIIQF